MLLIAEGLSSLLLAATVAVLATLIALLGPSLQLSQISDLRFGIQDSAHFACQRVY
jgi:hypothetical protein